MFYAFGIVQYNIYVNEFDVIQLAGMDRRHHHTWLVCLYVWKEVKSIRGNPQ